MEYKAVLFDFDFTLGDASQAIVAGFRYAFAQLGLPAPAEEAVRRTVGMTLEDAYTRLTGDGEAARREEFRRHYSHLATPMQAQVTTLFPGAEALLQGLHQAGVPLGVVTTKRTGVLRTVLEALGVLPLFSILTGSDRVARPKPDPQGLLDSCAALALAPGEVLFCGDTLIDAETAHRAGAPFCGVLNGTTTAADFAAGGFPWVHLAPDLVELGRWLGL